MDVSRYLDLRPAPRVVFDHLAERRGQVRFQVPEPGGGWRPVSWEDFAREIREVTLHLATSGLAPGDRAAVLAPNRVEWLSAALAIQAAGGVMVPIYPSSTAAQVGYVLRHSGARFLFVDTELLLARVLEAWGEVGTGLEQVVLLDDSLDPRAGREALAGAGWPSPSRDEVARRFVTWSRVRAAGAAGAREDAGAFDALLGGLELDQPGLMLYTSGTTGDPKGVPLTHRNVGVNGRDWLRCNGPLVEEGDIDLLWLPFSHIFGFGEACLGTTLGFTSYLSDPLRALARLPEVRPQVFMSVPRLWEKIATEAMAAESTEAQARKLAELTGGRLRFCLSGGAGLKREVKEFFHAHGLLIVEGYGLTEASPTLTLNRPDSFRFDSVGRPLPSVELKLAEDGEILARGESIFSGYHDDPAATAEALDPDGWLRTGDIGRFTADGFLQIVDRKKEILVTAGGKNVPPANIELRFANDPVIAHVVVYGDGRPCLVAGVWLQPGVDAAQARPVVGEKIAAVNGELARHETIKSWFLADPDAEPLAIENGLLTPTLKVRRKKVYESFRDRFEALYR